MTNEEAIELLCFSDWIQCLEMPKADLERIVEAISIVGKICINQSAHIDRDAWTAEWMRGKYPSGTHYLYCGKCKEKSGKRSMFCSNCGRAMTPEAWDMLEKRLRG